jgi:hypothetical protein
VIIGGLTTATLLVLVVLPALYLVLARRESRAPFAEFEPSQVDGDLVPAPVVSHSNEAHP